MSTEELKALLTKAYDAAWDNAGQGWNGEINGPADLLAAGDKEYFNEQREAAIAEILSDIKGKVFAVCAGGSGYVDA